MLREEVTWAWAAAVLARAGAPWAEKVAQERAVLLASIHMEADEMVWRVSLLNGELVAAC
jgi:uncharacterized protein YbaP (TraB family)